MNQFYSIPEWKDNLSLKYQHLMSQSRTQIYKNPCHSLDFPGWIPPKYLWQLSMLSMEK